MFSNKLKFIHSELEILFEKKVNCKLDYRNQPNRVPRKHPWSETYFRFRDNLHTRTGRSAATRGRRTTRCTCRRTDPRSYARSKHRKSEVRRKSSYTRLRRRSGSHPGRTRRTRTWSSPRRRGRSTTWVRSLCRFRSLKVECKRRRGRPSRSLEGADPKLVFGRRDNILENENNSNNFRL
jgi:hypothetical protein